MHNFVSLLVRYHDALLSGAAVSLELACIAWVVGLILGTAVGVWRASYGGRGQRTSITFLTALGSSIPVMVYLLWCHYPLQSMLGINVSPFITASVVFSLYNTLTLSEIVRSAIGDLPVAYGGVATVMGVPQGIYMRHVMIPLALRSALPGYLISQVGVLHMTLFASLISVNELFRVTQQINAIEYDAVGVFSLLALFYFVLSFPLLILAGAARKRLARLGLDR